MAEIWSTTIKDAWIFPRTATLWELLAKVRQAVADSLDELVNYPQVGYESLKKAIAQYEQVNKEQVICGNGAAELIYTLILALRPRTGPGLGPYFCGI